MIQPVSTTKLHNLQNVQACSGVQNAQKPQTNASATAPKKQGATLGAMAANIKQAGAKNGGVVNFKGTKEELTFYLKYKFESGDLDVKKENYTKIIKTSDGTPYTVTVKQDEKGSENSKKPNDEKNGTIEINNNIDKADKYSLSFNCHPEIYRKGTYFEKRYTEMKKKFGEI